MSRATSLGDALNHLSQKGGTPIARCPPKAALEQLANWQQNHTPLGIIYARTGFDANLWSKAEVSALMNERLVLRSETVNFMIDIANASYSIESLQYWANFATSRTPALIEGLQIWCANGDWLFLTEQIDQSRQFSTSISVATLPKF